MIAFRHRAKRPQPYAIDGAVQQPAKRSRRGTPWIVALLLVAVCLGRVFLVSATGQSDTPVNVAGIVVDFGDGRVSYALVPFDQTSISGVELLRRSGLSLLTVEFGGMGEGICAIEDTGCDLSTCRARLCQTGDADSPFWQYVRDGGEGTWQAAPLGASSSVIEHGDVDGWFWTGTAPQSGALTLDAVASETGVELGDFGTSPDADLEAIVVTEGGDSDNQALDSGSILAGIGVVAAFATLGGLLILRSRQGTR